MMLSITGVADCCRPNCQGEGCPSPAIAAPDPARAKSAQTMITNTAERLRTDILRIAPSNDGAPRAGRGVSKKQSGVIAQVGCRLESASAPQPIHVYQIHVYRATVLLRAMSLPLPAGFCTAKWSILAGIVGRSAIRRSASAANRQGT